MIPEPALFTHWEDFLKWLLEKTEKFPKNIRFTLSNRVNDLGLDIMEGIIEARYTRSKKDVLRRIDLNMEKLLILLRLCHDLRYLDNKGYEYAAREVGKAGKMVGGWRKQQEERNG